MVSNLTLNPWTKTDGMVITLIGLWLQHIESGDKEYVHAIELIDEGFKPAVVYDFYDDLIRNELVEPYDKTKRTLRPLVIPTANGLTKFLEIYQGRLDNKPKSQIEIVLLEEVCKTLEKLQTLFFSSERH